MNERMVRCDGSDLSLTASDIFLDDHETVLARCIACGQVIGTYACHEHVHAQEHVRSERFNLPWTTPTITSGQRD